MIETFSVRMSTGLAADDDRGGRVGRSRRIEGEAQAPQITAPASANMHLFMVAPAASLFR